MRFFRNTKTEIKADPDKIRTYPLVSYYLYISFKQWFLMLFLLIVPACFPPLLIILVNASLRSPQNLRMTEFQLPPLPGLRELSYDGAPNERLVYFSFAPNTEENQYFINRLLERNNL